VSDQPEALRLADELEMNCHAGTQHSAAAELRRQHAEIEALRAELAENEAAIRVWRGRTERAEAERDTLREALDWIARVNAMDYEYQAKARAAIDAARNKT
jgi:hypothetical protein